MYYLSQKKIGSETLNNITKSHNFLVKDFNGITHSTLDLYEVLFFLLHHNAY